ncbi:4Fe-4S dicluster domain-containing protein [Spirosoma sp. SC4-14]|uniref:4Fe-4S dicluster domain-containing protein n=1 Tax=Spirosoma sp. SC4-14 TaxID=3128900 RepID=UPI0030CEE6A9
MSYFDDIQSGIRTTLKGLTLTFRHIRNATHRRTPEGIASANYFEQQNGLVTLQYPHEQLPIPDNGRYRLRNEIDDCIVCDKCAKICPVDCITIDAIKATEEVGRASDGSPIRLYAAKFDIDMAKCCYCGLCTAVCPTECLTMDKKFDYSEFELGKLTYEFSNLTPEQADEKRALYEQFLREKEEQKAAQVAAKAANQAASAPAANPKPVFRPTAKPTVPSAPPENSEDSSIEHPLTDASPTEMEQIAQGGLETTKRPVFRPTKKPAVPVPESPVEARKELPEQKPESTTTDEGLPTVEVLKPKPAPFRPTMKPPKTTGEAVRSEQVEEPKAQDVTEPKPTFRPTMKPAKPPAAEPPAQAVSEPAPKAKPAFRPTMKPKAASASESVAEKSEKESSQTPDVPIDPPAEAPKSTVGFRPTMKPNVATTPAKTQEINPAQDTAVRAQEEPAADTPKPKPAFRPTMKPKAAPPKSDTDNKNPTE